MSEVEKHEPGQRVVRITTHSPTARKGDVGILLRIEGRDEYTTYWLVENQRNEAVQTWDQAMFKLWNESE